MSKASKKIDFNKIIEKAKKNRETKILDAKLEPENRPASSYTSGKRDTDGTVRGNGVERDITRENTSDTAPTH